MAVGDGGPDGMDGSAATVATGTGVMEAVLVVEPEAHTPGCGSAAVFTGSVIEIGIKTGGFTELSVIELRNTVSKGRPRAQAMSCRS